MHRVCNEGCGNITRQRRALLWDTWQWSPCRQNWWNLQNMNHAHYGTMFGLRAGSLTHWITPLGEDIMAVERLSSASDRNDWEVKKNTVGILPSTSSCEKVGVQSRLDSSNSENFSFIYTGKTIVWEGKRPVFIQLITQVQWSSQVLGCLIILLPRFISFAVPDLSLSFDLYSSSHPGIWADRYWTGSGSVQETLLETLLDAIDMLEFCTS